MTADLIREVAITSSVSS